MSESNGLSAWIDYKTIITLVSTAAMVGGLWGSIGYKIEYLTAEVKALRQDFNAANIRLYALERDMALWGRESQDLRDDLTELRRQSGLSTPQPRAVR